MDWYTTLSWGIPTFVILFGCGIILGERIGRRNAVQDAAYIKHGRS